MKILVTGGAGFIGSNLVNYLAKQEHDIVVLDDLSSGYIKNIDHSHRVKFIHGDIADKNLVDNVIKNVGVLFHLAASVGNKRSIDNPLRDAHTNAIGTLNILESAKESEINKIIITSSAGIFGELKYIPINEIHPVEPRTPYCVSKLYAEKISLAYGDLYDRDVICLRYFNVYGINQRYDAYGNVIPIFVEKILNKQSLQVFGSGEQTRDFVYVSDVVQANIKSATTKNLRGTFNIGSGTRISINQLVTKLKTISGEDFPVDYCAARAGEVMHSLADITLAKQSFNYFPEINIDEGLKKYFSWAQRELKQ